MFIFPRTVKFKTVHNLFFRRVHRVESARWVPSRGIWRLVCQRGKIIEIPSDGTIMCFGRAITPKYEDISIYC